MDEKDIVKDIVAGFDTRSTAEDVFKIIQTLRGAGIRPREIIFGKHARIWFVSNEFETITLTIGSTGIVYDVPFEVSDINSDFAVVF